MHRCLVKIVLASSLLALLLGIIPASAAPVNAGLADREARREIPRLTRPIPGKVFSEPTFGTRLRRVSNLSEKPCDENGCPFEAPTYSQLQAFNADSSLLLLTSSDGYRIRRLSDLKDIGVFPGFERQAPRWHPTKKNILIHFNPDYAPKVTLQETDVIKKKTKDIFTFSQYKALSRDPSFEEPSRDGRWLGGLATRTDGRLEIFSFDLINRRLGFSKPIDEMCEPDPDYGLLEPDWLAASPLGRYLVIQWKPAGTTRCSGLETYDIQTGKFAGRLIDTHPHGDLGVTKNGQEVFLTGTGESASSIGHPDDANMSGLAWYELPGTATIAPPHYVQRLDWKAIREHLSCQGPAGVCVVTSVSDPTATCCRAGWQPFQGEIWLQYLEGGSKANYAPVLRLAHHRSTDQGYWAAPKATISRDGRYVIFGSDWGIDPGKERVDPYIIELKKAK